VVIHFVNLYIRGRIFKLGLAKVMIASSACILGPATPAALAAEQGWRSLVIPGMLVGVVGHAIATFIGTAITTVLNF